MGSMMGLLGILAGLGLLIGLHRRRLADLRASVDAGVNASVLPIVSVASLAGFGTVVAALPAFDLVREWVLGIQGGPLVSLAVSTNVLAALTGSVSGGRSAQQELPLRFRWSNTRRWTNSGGPTIRARRADLGP